MWTKIIINKQMMIMHVVLQKQICIIFRLSHNSKTNLCSSIYHIAVLIVLQRQPPRNLQIIIFIERGFTACSLSMLPAYTPVDLACETFSACRKIKVVQRELSAAVLSVLDQRVV